MPVFDFSIPESAVASGFRLGNSGPHGNRTMMLAELSLLIDASKPNDTRERLRELAIEQNVLMKGTVANRREVFTRLGGLYGLDPSVLLWRVLRELWDVAPDDRPILALLCALARDPLFRATSNSIIDRNVGDQVLPADLKNDLMAAFSDTRNKTSCASTSRHAMSSWAQAGLLSGRTDKRRAVPNVGLAAAAYALLLGRLCEAQGLQLYETPWAAVLTLGTSDLDRLAFAASQRGLLEYRRMGNVLDITFNRWLGNKG